MKKVFYLGNCTTCKRIMEKYNLEGWVKRELKKEPISQEELSKLYALSGSYQALFSKKSTQIKQRNIDVSSLSEEDFKSLILDHYSFLKRPVFVTENQIFIGSDKNTIEQLDNFFNIKNID